MRAGDNVRITIQLIDARTDRHLWTESYQRNLRDVMTLQSEVANAIAAEVRIVLDPSAQSGLADPRPVDPAAYDEYLKGVHFLSSSGASNHQRSVVHLEKAVGLDPQYALAWARLADAYT